MKKSFSQQLQKELEKHHLKQTKLKKNYIEYEKFVKPKEISWRRNLLGVSQRSIKYLGYYFQKLLQFNFLCTSSLIKKITFFCFFKKDFYYNYQLTFLFNLKQSANKLIYNKNFYTKLDYIYIANLRGRPREKNKIIQQIFFSIAQNYLYQGIRRNQYKSIWINDKIPLFSNNLWYASFSSLFTLPHNLKLTQYWVQLLSLRRSKYHILFLRRQNRLYWQFWCYFLINSQEQYSTFTFQSNRVTKYLTYSVHQVIKPNERFFLVLFEKSYEIFKYYKARQNLFKVKHLFKNLKFKQQDFVLVENFLTKNLKFIEYKYSLSQQERKDKLYSFYEKTIKAIGKKKLFEPMYKAEYLHIMHDVFCAILPQKLLILCTKCQKIEKQLRFKPAIKLLYEVVPPFIENYYISITKIAQAKKKLRILRQKWEFRNNLVGDFEQKYAKMKNYINSLVEYAEKHKYPGDLKKLKTYAIFPREHALFDQNLEIEPLVFEETEDDNYRTYFKALEDLQEIKDKIDRQAELVTSYEEQIDDQKKKKIKAIEQKFGNKEYALFIKKMLYNPQKTREIINHYSIDKTRYIVKEEKWDKKKDLQILAQFPTAQAYNQFFNRLFFHKRVKGLPLKQKCEYIQKKLYRLLKKHYIFLIMSPTFLGAKQKDIPYQSSFMYDLIKELQYKIRVLPAIQERLKEKKDLPIDITLNKILLRLKALTRAIIFQQYLSIVTSEFVRFFYPGTVDSYIKHFTKPIFKLYVPNYLKIYPKRLRKNFEKFTYIGDQADYIKDVFSRIFFNSIEESIQKVSLSLLEKLDVELFNLTVNEIPKFKQFKELQVIRVCEQYYKVVQYLDRIGRRFNGIRVHALKNNKLMRRVENESQIKNYFNFNKIIPAKIKIFTIKNLNKVYLKKPKSLQTNLITDFFLGGAKKVFVKKAFFFGTAIVEKALAYSLVNIGYYTNWEMSKMPLNNLLIRASVISLVNYKAAINSLIIFKIIAVPNALIVFRPVILFKALVIFKALIIFNAIVFVSNKAISCKPKKQNLIKIYEPIKKSIAWLPIAYNSLVNIDYFVKVNWLLFQAAKINFLMKKDQLLGLLGVIIYKLQAITVCVLPSCKPYQQAYTICEITLVIKAVISRKIKYCYIIFPAKQMLLPTIVFFK